MSNFRSVVDTLISEDSIKERLPLIFNDSIVLDLGYKIVGISRHVSVILGAEERLLVGKSIDSFSDRKVISDAISSCMNKGFFNEKEFELVVRGKRLKLGISGFYLGLISEINGYIILRVRRLDESEWLLQELRLKREELNSFVYRSAHDLRGPLATIKGLVNLLKIRKDNDELERLIQLIESHTNILDERLFNMTYLAQSETHAQPDAAIDLAGFETRMRQVIEKNAFVDFLDFEFKSAVLGNEIPTMKWILPVAEHLLLHLLSMRTTQLNLKVLIRLAHTENAAKITIEASGFAVEPDFIEMVNNRDFIYTRLVQYPHMVNYYVAQKIALQAGAVLRLSFCSGEKQVIEVDFPHE